MNRNDFSREFYPDKNMDEGKGYVDKEGDKVWLCWKGNNELLGKEGYFRTITLSSSKGFLENKSFMKYLEAKVAKEDFQESLRDLSMTYALPASTRDLEARKDIYIEVGAKVDEKLWKVIDDYSVEKSSVKSSSVKNKKLLHVVKNNTNDLSDGR